MKTRIMYVEHKADGVQGPGCITRITFSKSGSSVYFRGRRLQKFAGYKANYFDVETGERYWVSGPKRNGEDRLYGGVVDVDEDVRDEYWTQVRSAPDLKHLPRFRARIPSDD